MKDNDTFPKYSAVPRLGPEAVDCQCKQVTVDSPESHNSQNLSYFFDCESEIETCAIISCLASGQWRIPKIEMQITFAAIDR